MQELNMIEISENELNAVAGAGPWWDNYQDALRIYEDLVSKATDAMCWASGNC